MPDDILGNEGDNPGTDPGTDPETDSQNTEDVLGDQGEGDKGGDKNPQPKDEALMEYSKDMTFGEDIYKRFTSLEGFNNTQKNSVLKSVSEMVSEEIKNAQLFNAERAKEEILAVKVDPEVGGVNFPRTQERLNLAFSKHDPEGKIKEEFRKTGLINNLHLVKFLEKVGAVEEGEQTLLSEQAKKQKANERPEDGIFGKTTPAARI